jgi:hypothetical protein
MLRSQPDNFKVLIPSTSYTLRREDAYDLRTRYPLQIYLSPLSSILVHMPCVELGVVCVIGNRGYAAHFVWIGETICCGAYGCLNMGVQMLRIISMLFVCSVTSETTWPCSGSCLV